MSRLLSEEDLSYPELGQSWPWVEIVTNHVDPKPYVLEFLKNQGVSGVILAGTGQGNIHQNLLPVIKEFSQRGIPVLRCSRTGLGVIRHNVSFNDDELGTLAAGSLTPAKARIALELLIYNRLIGKSLDFKKKLATI
jgi:L-asparaginase